jgi:predicted ATPase
MKTVAMPILTPDQRLRVFVSSTLQELAEERNVVREAIQNIHLTPVMFEMGARPHAARNLYREYLAQSQIFVGIYWDRYGWVSPEETISGLEDEYNLSGDMPKLIYIKKSAGQREERLTQLIKRIQSDDKVAYKPFTSAEELAELVANDLAILLTERFTMASQQGHTAEVIQLAFNNIPVMPNNLVGRDQSLRELTSWLQDPDKKLITLTGPGGIGKTRLALEVANHIRHEFTDGAAYVALAPVRDVNLVAETIAYTLGIKVSGSNVLESLKFFLQDKKMLLVLDNFEQIIEAATIIDDLLTGAPGVKILVTSRERLSLSFEHLYMVPTLSDTIKDASADQAYPPAIELFLQHAKSVQPSFAITEQNREVILEICQRLEGLPLAIELAAGQISLLSPALLLQKLDHRLDVLKGNFRDIPDRQRTMRKTIEWSYDLLSKTEQCLLLQMSLYSGGCLLEAVEKMHLEEEMDVYTVLGGLIDKSLLLRQEEDTQVRFQMFESVREFAIEKLKERNLMDACKNNMACYYHKALDGIKLQKNKINQVQTLLYLEREHANIRQVLEYLVEKEDVQRLTDMAWNLWLFWWVNAHTKEGYSWLMRAWDIYKRNPSILNEYSRSVLIANIGFMAFLQRDISTFQQTLGAEVQQIMKHPDVELVATAALVTGVVKTILKEYEVSDQMLRISLANYQKIGLNTGIGLVYSALGRNAVYNGNQTTLGIQYYTESLRIARQDNNAISEIISLAGLALTEAMANDAHAKIHLRTCIEMSNRVHFYEALAWSLEIWSIVSMRENNPGHAITLISAVDKLRTITQLPVWEDLQAVITQVKSGIQSQMDPVLFESFWNRGAAMNLDQMIAFTIAEQKTEVEAAA